MFFGERSLSWRALCAAALLFGSAALIWTNSRGGWISFSAGLLFVGTFVFLKTESKRILISRFFFIILVLFLAAPVYPRLYYKVVGRFMGPDGGSAESRLPQFEIAYEIIKDHPGLGVGINNYTSVMHQYDYTADGIDSITPHAVHNIFLHLGAEMGLPGLAVFVWFITSIFVVGMRRITGNGDASTYAAIGMLGGILAFLAHGLADVEGLGGKLYLFVWFFAGIISSIDGIQKKKAAV
jgi:putative inorganic carbon (HCO3(-)) transporter